MALSRRRLLRELGTSIGGASVASSIAGRWIPTVAGASWSPEKARGPSGQIRLHRNENPYGPSRKVVAAMQEAALTLANRYPNVETERLRAAVAERHRVPADHVVLGCGSREILRAAANAQLRSRGKLVAASPTFEWFARYSQGSGTKIVTVPLTKHYAHDLDAMLASIGPGPTLVYVCNPNNPTGTTTRPQDLEAFVRRLPATTGVLIDEAYHHYVSPSADYVSWLDRSGGRPTRHRDSQLFQDSRAGRPADRVWQSRRRDGASASASASSETA